MMLRVARAGGKQRMSLTARTTHIQRLRAWLFNTTASTAVTEWVLLQVLSVIY